MRILMCTHFGINFVVCFPAREYKPVRSNFTKPKPFTGFHLSNLLRTINWHMIQTVVQEYCRLHIKTQPNLAEVLRDFTPLSFLQLPNPIPRTQQIDIIENRLFFGSLFRRQKENFSLLDSFMLTSCSANVTSLPQRTSLFLSRRSDSFQLKKRKYSREEGEEAEKS